MAEKTEFKSLKFMLPRLPYIYPRLNEPDFKYKKEGEFSVKHKMKPKEFPKDILKQLEELRDELAESKRAELKASKKGALAKSLKVLDVLRPETDKDSGEETGFIIVNAKMTHSGVSKKTGKAWKRWPAIFDAKGVRLKNAPPIWGGSEGKTAVEAYAYYTPKDNEVGISFRLEAVQVLKLVSGGGQSASDYGFGEEEGFESDGEFDSKSSSSRDDDDADGDASGGAGDDF